MTSRLIVVFVLLITVFNYCQANDKKYEISGTLNYSYIKSVYDIWDNENFQRYNIQHIIDVEPALGYYIYNDFQLSFNPLYTYQYTTYNLGHYTSNNITLEDTEITVSHIIGIEAGPVYNFRITESLVLFAGVKAGLRWQFYDSRLSGGRGPKWSKAQVTFPIILGGAKYFITPDWAVLMQLQYKYTDSPNGRDYYNTSYILLGLGIAVYL